MADKKISALTSATTPLAGTEVLPIVQGSATVKVSVADLTVGRAVSASQLDVDNIRVDGNTISSTNTNGNVVLDPNGSGFVEVIGNGGTGVLANALSVTIPDTIGQRGSFRFQNASGGSLGGIAVEVVSAGVYPNAIGKIDVVVQNGGGSVRPMSFGVADSTFSLGNLVQGTAAKGVNFTANTPKAGMTSQLLNWYEEGTWTPVDSSGAGLTLTYTAAEMRYTRIGRNVFIQGRITYPSTASGATALIGGLPFTSSASNRAGISLGYNNFVANYVPLVSAGSALLEFYTVASGGVQPTNANLSAATFAFSGTYTV